MLEIIYPVLIFLALLIMTATLLPLLRVDEWWVRIFDFPRLQILTIGVALAVALAYSIFYSAHAFWKWVLIGLIACLVYQGYRMFPYTRLAPKQALDSLNSSNEGLLSILTANIYKNNRNASGFLNVVSTASPDVVLVIEPDQWWERQLSGLEASYPHTIKQPLGNTYGMLLYSRLKLRNSDIRLLVEDHLPSFFTEIELRSGRIIELYGLHPRPPRFGQDTDERDAEILIVGREVARAKKPVVVTGDLNDVAWSYTTTLFQKISGMVDPRIGRGFFNTYHAKYPIFRFPVDHIFHSPAFRLVEMKRLLPIGSDHFPILAVLSYEPEDRNGPRAPEADSDDRQEVDEIFNKVQKHNDLHTPVPLTERQGHKVVGWL
ncbi:endonuclease/exonuclease/phosphatase family protein [Nitrospira sp. T9]|uniref:endonuclease/exonuclease/phosphatase family protein n=1 Tax=unclassified Nitrospira TaxID=2652172 RepID=UPI003F9AD1A9